MITPPQKYVYDVAFYIKFQLQAANILETLLSLPYLLEVAKEPSCKNLLSTTNCYINVTQSFHFFHISKFSRDPCCQLQVLQKLMEKLTGEHLAVPEVTQSEEGQRTKLRTVLGFANKVLGINQVIQQPTEHIT